MSVLYLDTLPSYGCYTSTVFHNILCYLHATVNGLNKYAQLRPIMKLEIIGVH